MNKELVLVLTALVGLGVVFTLVEKKRFSSTQISLIAALSGLAALGRIPFAAVPSVQPTTFIVIVSGAVFGSGVGMLVGVFAAFVSNIFLGHGPWSLFQMLAWGLWWCV